MPYSNAQRLDPTTAYRKVRYLWPGAFALTATAGYINSVVLGFFRTPVSHMTGAVSHLGLDLSLGRMADAWASLSIVLGFLAGAFVSGMLVGALKLVPGRRYGIVMMVEGGLLVVAAALLAKQHRWGLPTVALACGLQNAMTSSYCGLMIRTTHVTGTMTDLGVMLGHWVRHRQVEGWKLGFLSLMVLAFFGGGVLGAFANVRFGPASLLVAATGTTLAGGVFWFTTQRGLVDLLQDAAPRPPRTSTFPRQ